MLARSAMSIIPLISLQNYQQNVWLLLLSLVAYHLHHDHFLRGFFNSNNARIVLKWFTKSFFLYAINELDVDDSPWTRSKDGFDMLQPAVCACFWRKIRKSYWIKKNHIFNVFFKCKKHLIFVWSKGDHFTPVIICPLSGCIADHSSMLTAPNQSFLYWSRDSLINGKP